MMLLLSTHFLSHVHFLGFKRCLRFCTQGKRKLQTLQLLNDNTHNMLTNMSFPHGEAWEIPECLLVGKTVWDAFQDFPKRKALFFFAGVVGSE